MSRAQRDLWLTEVFDAVIRIYPHTYHRLKHKIGERVLKLLQGASGVMMRRHALDQGTGLIESL